MSISSEDFKKIRPINCKSYENSELKEVVKEFIGYLDYTETSDSGHEWHPIIISCCRSMMQDKVNSCLKRMKELSM